MMLNAFISYAHEDIESATRLYQDLKACGFAPWLDKERLLPGMKWRPAIRKAIRESDFFLALLSKQSTSRKGFVHREMNEALEILKEFPDDRIYLIPIRLDDCSIPFEELSDIQYVNFFPNWETGLEMVLKVMDVDKPIESAETKKQMAPSRQTYNYRVGMVDLDIGLTNLSLIASKLNSIQTYFHFTCPKLPSITEAIRVIGGKPNLAVYEVPEFFYTEHQYLSVDLVACLSRYPLAFREEGRIQYNYFSGPGEKDERFMFASTHLLYDFTKEAGCTFEKGMVYIIVSCLVVYFTEWGYHHKTRGCVMDFCQNRSEMVEGLKAMRFCSWCESMIENSDLKNALDAMLHDDIRV
jgi:hypothetical protein